MGRWAGWKTINLIINELAFSQAHACHNRAGIGWQTINRALSETAFSRTHT
jgi:hypothetical protein